MQKESFVSRDSRLESAIKESGALATIQKLFELYTPAFLTDLFIKQMNVESRRLGRNI